MPLINGLKFSTYWTYKIINSEFIRRDLIEAKDLPIVPINVCLKA